jgi:hypothetical protein
MYSTPAGPGRPKLRKAEKERGLHYRQPCQELFKKTRLSEISAGFTGCSKTLAWADEQKSDPKSA